jgi:hypothetical protein
MGSKTTKITQANLVDELNRVTHPYTRYAWNYTMKDDYTLHAGFYLSFAENTMDGDILHRSIQTAFQTQGYKVSILGNGFNAANGTRLLVEAETIPLDVLAKVAATLHNIYKK